MSLAEHVAEVLRAVPARVRDDVCMLGVWLTADGAAGVGWETARRAAPNGTAWEWNQWRFECPDALVVQAAPPRQRVEAVLRAMHHDGRIAAALGHPVGLIVDGEVAPC